MNENEIAFKYVHGHHDALTDSQEKIDMAKDILDFAKEYRTKQLKLDCNHEGARTYKRNDGSWFCFKCR